MSWLAYRLPACSSFAFISWRNQELGTLLMESCRPPHLARAWRNECLPGPECSVLLISTHTYITCPSSTWAAREHGVVSGVSIHMTGHPAWGWVCLRVWASPASCQTLSSSVSFLDISPFASDVEMSVPWDLSPLGLLPPCSCHVYKSRTQSVRFTLIPPPPQLSSSLPEEHSTRFLSNDPFASRICLPSFWAPTVSPSAKPCVFPNALWTSSQHPKFNKSENELC